MSMRYLGGYESTSYNPLASNITTSPSVAQWNGVYTLPQAAQAQASGQWVTEPNFKQTTLLLHADGKANGSLNNTFLDSSTNNFTITRNGDTTQGTFTPFSQVDGTWSNYFDSSGDYLTLPSNAAFTLGTGDFTIECWVNHAVFGAGAEQGILQISDTSGGLKSTNSNTIALASWNSSGKGFRIYANATTGESGVFASAGTWYHLAVVRASGTTKLYINGVLGATVASDTTNYTGTYLAVGGYYSTSYLLNGYLSNLRIVKGTAVYTSNFTPSTVPLTNITNTSLLTCQSNRFVDNGTANSGSGFAITVNGNPSVQAFSPFAPQYAYTSSLTGGSAYFDGTGDYTSSSITAIGTNDFTIEYWSYLNAHSGTSNEGGYFQISGASGGLDTTYTVGVLASRASAANGRVLSVNIGNTSILTTYVPNLGEWFHTAIVRQSNSVKIYVNGTLVSTPTTVNTNLTGAYVALGGYYSTSYLMNGYLSGFRVVNTAVYTGNFTIPTTPLSTSGSVSAASYTNTANVNTSFAVANTSLLCNFTNAGIIDSTAKYDIQTVGTAQVNTTIVKNGSGSIYLDGSSTLYINKAVGGIPANWNFYAGDFTIEFWMYSTAVPATEGYFMTCGAGGAGGVNEGWRAAVNTSSSTSTAGIYFAAAGVTSETKFFSWPTLNNWHHVAYVRSNGTISCYLDGVASSTTINIGTSAINTISSGYQTLCIGGLDTSRLYYTGYLDDIRVTKGVARYTSNFVPPKVAFSNQ